MENLKDKLFVGLFFVLSTLIAVGYFVFDRKNWNLLTLLNEAKSKLLTAKIEEIEELSKKGKAEYEESKKKYIDLMMVRRMM